MFLSPCQFMVIFLYSRDAMLSFPNNDIKNSHFEFLPTMSVLTSFENDLYIFIWTHVSALLGPFWFWSARPMVLCTLQRTVDSSDPSGRPTISNHIAFMRYMVTLLNHCIHEVHGKTVASLCIHEVHVSTITWLYSWVHGNAIASFCIHEVPGNIITSFCLN